LAGATVHVAFAFVGFGGMAIAGSRRAAGGFANVPAGKKDRRRRPI
jgi:hypothetical protein